MFLLLNKIQIQTKYIKKKQIIFLNKIKKINNLLMISILSQIIFIAPNKYKNLTYNSKKIFSQKKIKNA